MSSGFVSGGSLEQPAERDDAWKKAQEELEAKRKRKEEDSQASNGKSLFETLQANKAAKEEAFAEAARLKNQFRAIDEDEADFLESVLESTRAKEDAIKKETADSLAAFRKQQEEKEKAALVEDEEEAWNFSGKKRKKGKQKEFLKGVKLRKTSSVDGPGEALATTNTENSVETSATEQSKASTPISTTAATSPIIETSKTVLKKPRASPITNLGLGNYTSDEDD